MGIQDKKPLGHCQPIKDSILDIMNGYNSTAYKSCPVYEAADLSQKPGGQEAKQYSIIGFTVKPRHADVTKFPKFALPSVQGPGSKSHINQNNIGAAFNEPAPKVDLQVNNGRTGEKGFLLFYFFNEEIWT